jgi:hypothetical protein
MSNENLSESEKYNVLKSNFFLFVQSYIQVGSIRQHLANIYEREQNWRQVITLFFQ